jgi:menaquinone-dependent protoporphyrinogen oxidase
LEILEGIFIFIIEILSVWGELEVLGDFKCGTISNFTKEGDKQMKTLIVYGSRYGCTENCAKVLKEKMDGEVDLYHVKERFIPDLSGYDNVIIGGSIYEGRIQRQVRQFCEKNLDQLMEKNVGLFVCGLQNGERAEVELMLSYPHELIEKAVAVEFIGGEIHLERMNFFDKFILKIVSKQDKSFSYQDISTVSYEKLDEIVQALTL